MYVRFFVCILNVYGAYVHKQTVKSPSSKGNARTKGANKAVELAPDKLVSEVRERETKDREKERERERGRD